MFGHARSEAVLQIFGVGEHTAAIKRQEHNVGNNEPPDRRTLPNQGNRADMQDVIDRLKRLIEEGQGFTHDNFAQNDESGYPELPSPEWLSWTGRTRLTVENTYGMDSVVGETLSEGLKTPVIGMLPDRFNMAKSYMIGALTTALDGIREGLPVRQPVVVPDSGSTASGRVFVVHGHDSGLKTDLELFLKGVGLDPVVLHREPDQGATLLEKFEKHSDVGYAFVLLTPDEVAFTANQLSLPESERKLEKRARLVKTLRHKIAGIVVRQVWTGPNVDTLGSVSLDGRYLSYVHWETGNRRAGLVPPVRGAELCARQRDRAAREQKQDMPPRMAARHVWRRAPRRTLPEL